MLLIHVATGTVFDLMVVCLLENWMRSCLFISTVCCFVCHYKSLMRSDHVCLPLREFDGVRSCLFTFMSLMRSNHVFCLNESLMGSDDVCLPL